MLKWIMGISLGIVFTFLGIHVAGQLAVAKVLEGFLGVPVHVRRIELGWNATRAGVYGLTIENPSGFSERNLASIPEIAVRYDLSALLRGVIHIRHLRLNLEHITVERNRAGKFNLMELKAARGPLRREPPVKVERPPEAAGTESRERDSRPPVAVRIDEVHLSVGAARYVDSSETTPSVREFSLNIENAVLRDITEPSQVVRQVVMMTMQKVGLNALVPDWSQMAAAFHGEAGSKLEALAEKLKLSFAGKAAQ